MPKKIEKAGNIYLKKSALKNLKSMQEDYATIMNEKDHLELISGYLSYEELMNQYINLEAELGEHVKNFILPAGHNEQQLGYTVVIKEAETWNELCVKEKTYVDFNYDSVKLILDEKMTNKMNWIQNNCYRYGFVLRYPYGKEKVTGQEYQPFVLRYVGEETAKKMFKSNKTLEEMDLPRVIE